MHQIVRLIPNLFWFYQPVAGAIFGGRVTKTIIWPAVQLSNYLFNSARTSQWTVHTKLMRQYLLRSNKASLHSGFLQYKLNFHLNKLRSTVKILMEEFDLNPQVILLACSFSCRFVGTYFYRPHIISWRFSCLTYLPGSVAFSRDLAEYSYELNFCFRT